MTIPYILDMIGTVAFAVSGALVGVRKEMDFYGVTFLALMTAVGGGTTRDIMVGKIPPIIFADYNYLIVSVIVSFAVFFYHRHFESKMHLFLTMDALGLGVFTVTGASVGLAYDVGWAGAVMLAVITGTFGGMFRDILAKEIPLVLQKEIYASAAMLGGIIYCLCHYAGVNKSVNFILVTSFVFSLRMISLRRKWGLPVVKIKQ
ncbi:MAG TPA: hypothetical protein DCM31_00735 [Deferribacteraceae bacterium]|jgi:uncharacterized membrane protein YeiH|nr:hypothetical protein [Deferribacteraceae bacterium]